MAIQFGLINKEYIMRKINYSLSVIMSSLGLISCSMIYPHYDKPVVDTPTNWANMNQPLNSESNIAYTAWWRQFNDPRLNQLIESGLLVNNTVQKAYGNLELAQGQLKAVELSWLPSLTGLAGYSSNPALGNPQVFYGIMPVYASLNIFNTLARQKSASINAEAANYAVEATKLAFIGQMATGYYTYTAELEMLKLYDTYLNDMREMLDIQKADFAGGLNSQIGVKGLSDRYNAALSNQKTIKSNILKSQNALRYLLNQNPGAIAGQADFSSMNTVYGNFGTQPATVLKNRPDVALAEAQYRLAVQNVGVATSQLLPSVQLDYFAGQVDVAQSGLPNGIYGPLSDAYANWSVNPAVFGQISALSGSKKVAYVNYIDTVRKALHDVDNDLINHRDANERYDDLNKSYQSARDKYRLNYDLYRQGIIAYSATLEDKLAVDQAAIALNRVKLFQMVTLVNLYQDLGGGYRYAESVPVSGK